MLERNFAYQLCITASLCVFNYAQEISLRALAESISTPSLVEFHHRLRGRHDHVTSSIESERRFADRGARGTSKLFLVLIFMVDSTMENVF